MPTVISPKLKWRGESGRLHETIAYTGEHDILMSDGVKCNNCIAGLYVKLVVPECASFNQWDSSSPIPPTRTTICTCHLLQVDLYKHNYRSTIGWWKWLFWADPHSYLFSEISKGRKPMSRRVSELMMQHLFTLLIYTVCTGCVCGLLNMVCIVVSIPVHVQVWCMAMWT